MIRSTTISPRLLASAAVVALSVGLLAAPGARAADATQAVTDPKADPSPGFLSTGVRTDACDDTTTPGWIGTTTPGLGVTALSPQARFAVWDESAATETKVFDQQVQTGTDGSARTRPTGLTDGHTYAWRAWPQYAPGSGRPTAECHFRVDTTQPGLTVASTDFPSSGTTLKYAGQTGTFTLTGTDQGSGVACYHYVLNGSLGVGWNCQSPGTAVAGADGSASIDLKPKSWGTNTLTVQAADNAGNLSQPLDYTFYAPSNPNPPSAPGDVDGDGVPDILLPDAAGGLQIISASADGTAPTSVIPADALPEPGTTWSDWQVAHRGWDNHEPVDDLFVHRSGGGWVYLYRNFELGTFGSQDATILDRPTGCGAVACPDDYATDWSKATQLVSLGALGAGTRPSLMTVEDGNLWLFTNPGFMDRFRTVQKLSTTGSWAGYDVIAPGKAADGSLALWSRERATGALRSYPIGQNADGTYDFSALADPASGTVVGGLPVAAFPTLGSSGDGNGDGVPDLYAVTADRHLLTFSGVTSPKDLGVLR